MKKLATFSLAILSLVLFQHTAFAQCVPITTNTQPGIYPDTLPEGTVGQLYNEDITFVMPLDTMGFDFTNFEIVSIALPAGLTWACNSPATNCNYNPQVNQYGCVHLTGTPLLAGDYNVEVSALADLTVANNVGVTFNVFFRVNPASISASNGGFSLTSSSTCAPSLVSFTNNNPGLVAYTWDFGNGATSTLENPSPQYYGTPGEFIINYAGYTSTATTNIYTLTNFSINTMSNYGGNFPAFEDADGYFKILNGATTVYQSSIITDTDPPVSWTLNVNLNPSTLYTIEVWESDAGEFGFGADDPIGTIALDLNGCTNCAVTDGTISYTINHQVILPTPSVVSTDTIVIYGFPATPSNTYNASSQEFSTSSTEPILQWYFNNNAIAGATNTTYQATASGDYYVVAFSAGNCASFSDTIFALICDTTYVPTIQLVGTNSISVANPQGLTITWYRNNVVVAGQSNTILDITSGGSYYATLSDSLGCIYPSNQVQSTLTIEDLVVNSFEVYPNPTNGILNITSLNMDETIQVALYDLNGKLIQESTILPLSKTQIDIANLEPQVLILVCSGTNWSSKKRIVKL